MAKPVILTAKQLTIDASCNILKAEDYAAYLEARDIIDTAHQQAAEIAKEAQEAYQQEKQRGYEEGMEASKVDQADQMLKVVNRTITYLADVEQSLADILLSGVKKIIGDFDQEQLAINLVKNALQHVRNEKQVTIRTSPGQYNIIKDKLNEILAEYKGVGFIDLVADQRLSSGDCIMESEIGVVDASVDVQVKALQKRFEQLRSKAGFMQDPDLTD